MEINHIYVKNKTKTKKILVQRCFLGGEQYRGHLILPSNWHDHDGKKKDKQNAKQLHMIITTVPRYYY